MRPLLLTIKGLNSFKEEEKIDFKKLTERGLFGIFGSTGSGKSSILDAIILALYGRVPRLKPNENAFAINTESKAIEVLYSFAIKEEIFTVQRKIVAKKGGGSITKVARFYKENGDILADKASDVNKELIKLIGLELEDFTRSVVLPQGKFSEFLKLTGSKRREMLERIFMLQDYGTKLRDKLNKRKKDKEKELTRMRGQLDILQDFSLENYELLKKKILELSQEKRDVSSDLKILNEDYEEFKKNLEKEDKLKNLKNNNYELLKEDKKFEEDEKTLTYAKLCLEISPEIKSFRKLEIEASSYEKTLKDLEKNYTELNLLYKEHEKIYFELTEKKDTILPQLLEKRVILNSKLEKISELEELETKFEQENLLKNNLLEKKEILAKEVFLLKEDLKKSNDKILKFENLKKENELEIDYKKEITILYNKKEILLGKSAILKEEEQELKELKKDFELKTKESLEIKEDFNKGKKISEALELEIKNLKNIDYATKLILLKTRINEVINAEKNFERLTKEIENLKKQKDELNIEKFKKNLDLNKEIFSEIEKEYKNLEKNNMAYLLHKDLKKGDKCPVCGSSKHKTLKFEKNEEFEKVQTVYEIKKKVTDDLELTFLQKNNKHQNLENEIKSKSNEINTINNINKDFLLKEEKELQIKQEKSKSDIKKLEEEKITLNNKMQIKGEDKARLEEANKNIEEKIKKISKKTKNLKNELKELEDKKFENIESLHKELEEKEKNFKDADKNLENLRTKKIKLETEFNSLNEESQKLELEFSSFKSDLKNLEKRLDELKAKTKNLSINDLENLNKEINLLEFSYEEAKKLYIDLREKEDLDKKEFDLENKKYQDLENDFKNKSEIINTFIKKNDFKNIEEIEGFFLENSVIQNLEEGIKIYKDKLIKLKYSIESLEIELKGKNLNKKDWEKIKEEKLSKEVELISLEKELAVMQGQEKEKNEKLEQFKGILEEEKKLSRDYDNLDDLFNLFKGNAFVEFIAINKLKYIAKDASKRLEYITRGRYTLEVDDDGSFIVRDNYNGGIKRNTSTLSGGESFLSSLSLALALSNNIQLKGKAPLEFFFLDEGFGTLDTDLLDELISSLEKLHSDKLKVGIITHVEEVKNRIHRKLIVKQAIPGERGTKLELEL